MSPFVKVCKIYAMSPNSCNRGEDKRPKDVIFGDIMRDRQSSQSIKRPTRDCFAERCLNSPFWDEHVAEEASKILKVPLDAAQAAADAVFGMIGLPASKRKANKEAKPTKAAEAKPAQDNDDEEEGQDGNVSIRLSVAERDWLLAKTVEFFKMDPKAQKALVDGKEKKEWAKAFLAVYRETRSAEIAVFGRFIASLRDMCVDAAACFSHAISTNVANNEQIDDFVAVDDLRRRDGGAGHMNHDFISASCMFAEMSCNINTLLANLGGNKAAARKALKDLLMAYAVAIPRGKRTSMFSAPRPAYISFEVLGTEISLMDAFLSPVSGKEEGKPLDVESIKRLIGVRERKYGAFGIECANMAEVCPDAAQCGVKNATTLDKAVDSIVASIKELK